MLLQIGAGGKSSLVIHKPRMPQMLQDEAPEAYY